MAVTRVTHLKYTMSDSKTKRKPIQDGGSAKKRAKVLLRALQPCSFKARRYEEIENVNLNTPMSIANLNWVSNWGVKEALREKLTNMIDQARWVSSRFCNGAEVHFLEGKGTLIVYVGELLLAQAKWGVRRANYFADEFKEGGSKKSRAEGTSSVKETMVIEMTNYSSSLRWDSFFIGRTTKKHDKCVIGKHGEGLSGACVALTRIGCNLTAMCSKGGYIADIFRFHNDSVCVQLVRRPTSKSPNPRLPQDTVRFKVVFDPEMEVNVEELLNEIRLPLDATKITTTRGELLVGPACKGRYFNRGIYVEEVPKSQFGYNFYDPDKDLLQGRDRNSHTKHIGKECGTILSEAILQDPEVCKKVMEMFLYQGAGAPTADGMTFESFEDIKGGEFILPEAREALRKCAIAERCEGKEGIFCASSTGQLELICKAQGARIIYSHAFLHNHQLAVRNFHLTLTAHAAEFDPCCRIGTMSQRLLPLLKTQSLRRSSVKVPMVAFWRVEDAVYVTGSDALSHSGGLTLLQEYSIHNSLLSCGLSLLDVLNIVRVLKGEVAENEDDSDGELRGEKEEECEEDAAAKSPTALVNLTRTENEPDTPDGAAVAAGSSANTSMEITDDESEEDAAAGAADTSTDLSDSASQTDAAAAAAVSGDSAYDSGADEEGEADYSSDSDIDDSD